MHKFADLPQEEVDELLKKYKLGQFEEAEDVGIWAKRYINRGRTDTTPYAEVMTDIGHTLANKQFHSTSQNWLAYVDNVMKGPTTAAGNRARNTIGGLKFQVPGVSSRPPSNLVPSPTGAGAS